MIPDRCGNAPPHAPATAQVRKRLIASSTFNDSLSHPGSSPWRSRASVVAQRGPPCCRSPTRAAVLTSEHHPPPTLDHVAEWPKVPGSTGPCPRPGPGLGRTGPGRCQARRNGPARPARTGQDRWSARHRSRDGSSYPVQSRAHEYDRACWASLHAHPRRRSARPASSDGLAESNGRFADDDSAGIPSNAIQHSLTATTLPWPGRCCIQGALLSSDDYGSSVERDSGRHPL